jgi:ankyrin repeat protein
LTPLGLAAVYGHKNVALLLLSEDAKIDAVGITGETPLHEAAANGSTDVAKLLLDRGANVSARDIFGATPLASAALKGHKSLATLLLARGAVVNVRVAISDKTPLHVAAASGHKEMVALLLAHGADLNARNSDGQTPLQEMQASSLDAATKKSLANVLQPKPKEQVTLPTPVQAAPLAPVQAPAPSVASTQPT